MAIEGTEANHALATFVETTGLDVLPMPQTQHRGDSLTLLAAIVTVPAAVVTIADRILAWRDHLREQREREGVPLLKAVLEGPDGHRVILRNATREEIADALACLQPTDENTGN